MKKLEDHFKSSIIQIIGALEEGNRKPRKGKYQRHNTEKCEDPKTWDSRLKLPHWLQSRTNGKKTQKSVKEAHHCEIPVHERLRDKLDFQEKSQNLIENDIVLVSRNILRQWEDAFEILRGNDCQFRFHTPISSQIIKCESRINMFLDMQVRRKICLPGTPFLVIFRRKCSLKTGWWTKKQEVMECGCRRANIAIAGWLWRGNPRKIVSS